MRSEQEWDGGFGGCGLGAAGDVVACEHGDILALTFLDVEGCWSPVAVSDLLRSSPTGIVPGPQRSLVPTLPPLETGGCAPRPPASGENPS